MSIAKIPKGYVLKARAITNSEISKASPYVREIFDWLILNARHKDGKVSGTILKRGELLTNYNEITQALAWYQGFHKLTYSKDQCDKAMRWLRKRQMIESRKTTRGVIITISNYDYYQNPANYESGNDSGNGAAMERQGADTINKNGKNAEKENNEHTHSAGSDFELWWKEYPIKVGKKAALKAWQNAKDKPTVNDMIVQLKKQCNQEQWKKENGRFIPNPAKYINEGRWDDEIETISDKSKLIM